ncbi:phage repressor protein [Escherichia sp. E14S1]|uniref:phage repressor protein n=1 Tax=Escherichia sp. E14S1 TaxID=2478968 RepID=UPI00102A1A63|nr:phage repressor protein [Escherichia sp. E14S1]RZN17077.1 phage repressor protein [Escherichia sp. E14S1]
MSKKSIEKEYKRFLQTAERWKELVVANSVFHDTSYAGEEFRHVALTHDQNVLEEAEKCLAEWKAFVDLCRNADGKASNIVESVYSPIPIIIEDTNQSTHIVVQSATTTRSFTRENLLKKYDAIIKKSLKNKIFSQIVGALEEERRFFAAEPEGEIYRARKEGYTDVVLTTNIEDSNTLSRFRVGAHGALVFAKLPDTTVPVVNNVGERRSITIYSGVESIPCGLIGDFSLYRVRDLEKHQPSYVAKSYILRNIDIRSESLKNKSTKMLEEADPAIRHIIERKIQTAREAMARLNKMDLELIDVMMMSGDDLTGIKLTDARKRYGKTIEERYGFTFSQTQRAAKLW